MAFINYINGTNTTVGVGVAGEGTPGGTFTNLGGLTALNMSIVNDVVDFSNNDTAYDVKRYGRQRITGSMDCLYDPGDAAQNTLLGYYRTRTIAALRFRPQGGGAYNEYANDVILTSANVTTANNGLLTASFSFESTGTVALDTGGVEGPGFDINQS